MTAGLKERGVGNLRICYINMFRNTITGNERHRYTLRPGLGTTGNLREFTRSLTGTNSRFITKTDTAILMSRKRGFNLREDVIRGYNRRYLIDRINFGALRTNLYSLNNSGVAKIITNDVERLTRLGFDSFLFRKESASSTFNEKIFFRDEAALHISSALVSARERTSYIVLDGSYVVPLYFGAIDAINDIEMETSLYPFVTDTIPFKPLVLRGSLELFAGNLNEAASLDDYILRLIEWGLYPSAILTWEGTEALHYSDMNRILSSKYKDWKEELLRVYDKVNNALKDVIGFSINSHHVLDIGVIKTTYDNGFAVFVNNNNIPWAQDNITIPARGTITRRLIQ
jgi:hypothetical protein